MDTEQKIDTAQEFLKADGNIIKTRDDCGLIFIDEHGKVQNTDCS